MTGNIVMASWSKTDWIVVVSFLLITLATALYCLQFYCRRSESTASPTDLLIDDLYEGSLSSASAKSSPSQCRSSELAKSQEPHSNLNLIGWSRPPDWESHDSKSESDFDGNARQPTPFFINIPNEHFSHEVSNRDLIST